MDFDPLSTPRRLARLPRRLSAAGALLAGLFVAVVAAEGSASPGGAPGAPLRGRVAARVRGAGDGLLRVGRGERLLVVAPHPDDEVIGAGGLAQRVVARGGQARVLLLTAGDGYVDAVRHETGIRRPPAEEFIAYGERRLGESRAAARVLGPGISVDVMGFPDAGLELLLRRHDRAGPPLRSPTTGASDPPYDGEALEPDLPYDGRDLRRAMARAIRDARPTIVVVPDPADVHPDHRATATFALLALSDVEAERGARRPRVLTFLVHWPDWPPGWDRRPRDGDSSLPLVAPADLPRRALAPRRLELTSKEVARKRAALDEHATQMEVMPEFLGAFVRQDELFGEIPLGAGRGMERWIESLRATPSSGASRPSSAPGLTSDADAWDSDVVGILGKVVGIWRHPVKSMRGESLVSAEFRADGMAGDRGWAVRDDAVGEIRGAKKLPDLLRCSARYPEEPVAGRVSAAEIELPDGRRFRSDSPEAARLLTDFLGRGVSLWPRLPAESREHYRRVFEEGVDPVEDLRAIFGRLPDEPLPDLSVFPPELFELTSPAGTYFDAFPLHLVTTGHLDFLRRRAPDSSFDPLRFRPNLLVETPPGTDAPPELDWCGRELRVGAARISVTVPCPRCVMTTLPQGDLPKDPAVLRTIVRDSGQNVGVYANVMVPGRVSVGDVVESVEAGA